jgi:hypothetical protein
MSGERLDLEVLHIEFRKMSYPRHNYTPLTNAPEGWILIYDVSTDEYCAALEWDMFNLIFSKHQTKLKVFAPNSSEKRGILEYISHCLNADCEIALIEMKSEDIDKIALDLERNNLSFIETFAKYGYAA